MIIGVLSDTHSLNIPAALIERFKIRGFDHPRGRYLRSPDIEIA